jgi:hypothetical protein
MGFLKPIRKHLPKPFWVDINDDCGLCYRPHSDSIKSMLKASNKSGKPVLGLAQGTSPFRFPPPWSEFWEHRNIKTFILKFLCVCCQILSKVSWVLPLRNLKSFSESRKIFICPWRSCAGLNKAILETHHDFSKTNVISKIWLILMKLNYIMYF